MLLRKSLFKCHLSMNMRATNMFFHSFLSSFYSYTYIWFEIIFFYRWIYVSRRWKWTTTTNLRSLTVLALNAKCYNTHHLRICIDKCVIRWMFYQHMIGTIGTRLSTSTHTIMNKHREMHEQFFIIGFNHRLAIGSDFVQCAMCDVWFSQNVC